MDKDPLQKSNNTMLELSQKFSASFWQKAGFSLFYVWFLWSQKKTIYGRTEILNVNPAAVACVVPELN